MSRAIPAAYPLPDPDRSFVPGQGKIDAGNLDTNPPHGPADLAAAIRYLFANGKATLVVPQTWDSDGVRTYTQNGLGTAVAEWKIPHDPAFPGLRVTIDYEAHVDLDPGFRVTATELAESVNLDTVAAGGAIRRVTKEWTIPGMDRTYGGDSHTVTLQAAGNGVSGNGLISVWLERLPAEDSIGAGVWYEAFTAPDSTAYSADRPLTSDKVEDLATDLTELANVRYHVFLVWSKLSGASYPAAAKLGTLSRLLPDSEGLNTGLGWIKLTGGSATIAGSRLAWREVTHVAEVSELGWKTFTLPINAASPQIADRLSFQQLTVMPELMGYLSSVSIFGL